METDEEEELCPHGNPAYEPCIACLQDERFGPMPCGESRRVVSTAPNLQTVPKPLTVQQLHQRNAAWNHAFDEWWQESQARQDTRMSPLSYELARVAYMAGRAHQSAIPARPNPIPQASTWAAPSPKPIPEGER